MRVRSSRAVRRTTCSTIRNRKLPRHWSPQPPTSIALSRDDCGSKADSGLRLHQVVGIDAQKLEGALQKPDFLLGKLGIRLGDRRHVAGKSLAAIEIKPTEKIDRLAAAG